MRKYGINEKENKTMKPESIIKEIFDHNNEQMILYYIGDVVKDYLD